MATGSEILLTKQQHSDLSSIAQSRSLPAGYVFRAKLILLLAEGASFNAIKRQLQTTAPTILRWKQRFRQSGVEGLDTYHPGQKPRVLTPALRARILSATRSKPSDGSTHWSCRKLASALGVSKDAVHRVWQEAGLKPHRLERYMTSDDPEFETKAADILASGVTQNLCAGHRGARLPRISGGPANDSRLRSGSYNPEGAGSMGGGRQPASPD